MLVFCKQTPIGYFGILIGAISIIYFILNFDKKNLIYVIAGTILIISVFLALIFSYQIPIQDILIQHFLFPISLGEFSLGMAITF